MDNDNNNNLDDMDTDNSDPAEYGLEDMMGTPCMDCHKGLFDETTVTDAKNGVLHCDKCDFEVFRYMLPEDLDNLENLNTLTNDIYGEDTVDNSFDNVGESSMLNEEFLSKYYAKKPVKKCTDYHPPLSLTIDGQEVKIYGSSCQKPIVKDADLYISLDNYAPVYLWEQPWYINEKNQQHIRFFIDDMDVPSDLEEFDELINYAIDSLVEGKKVHAGCIAGHGRTGTFLAAITQRTMGEKLAEEGISAIDYVRDNYCKKAVETLSQVLYLHIEFGVAIPRLQTALVNEFKEMFLEEVGVSFDELLKEEDFATLKPAIDSLESAIYRKYNPPKPKGNFTRADFANADNNKPWTPEGSNFTKPNFGKI